MFRDCSSIRELNLSMDATYMERLFEGCSALEKIIFNPISSKSNYFWMDDTFKGCSSLKYIDFRGLNASSRRWYFENTTWDEEYVDKSLIFEDCPLLEEIFYPVFGQGMSVRKGTFQL